MAANKAGILRNILLTALSFFVGWSVQAQTGMLSPYSAFGAGTIQPYLNVRNMSMGGIAVALSSPGDMNPFNPATYRTGVDTLSVRFNIGFNLGMNKLRQNIDGREVSNQSTSGGLGNLEFYFPVCKWYKMGLYLLPVTDINYRSSYFSDTIPHIGQTQLIHDGSGGLSKVGWGHAFGWGPVSVGVNLAYMFGRMEQNATLSYMDDSLASAAGKAKFYTDTRLNGFSLDVGLSYSIRLHRSHYLTIGAAYSMATTLYGKRTTMAKGEFSSVEDTAFLPSVARRGKIIFPSSIRAGVSYEMKGQYLIGVDFTYTWWNDFKDYGKTYDYFENTFSVNVGAELKNDPQAVSRARRVAYRIGGFYQQQCVSYDGHRLQSFGVSIGVGIPVRKSRSLINIGVQYGKTGSLNLGQIREDYMRIGVSFSSLETWFVKPKYD